MSAELETLFREAADGPVPHLDVAALRRRGRRRRDAIRTAGVGGLAGAVALGVAVVPDLRLTVPVVDAPVIDAPVIDAPVDDAAPDPTDLADPRFEIVEAEGCRLRFVEGGEVRIEAPLDAARGRVLCSDTATSEDVRALEMLFAEIGREPGGGEGTDDGHRVIGVLDGDVAEVELLLEGSDRIRVATHVVATPGAVPVAGYVALVPGPPIQVRSIIGLDAAGQRLFERTPDRHLHGPRWDMPAVEWDRPPAGPSSAVPVDDLPLVAPDPPLLGSWRPERSPVDLTPLSLRGSSEEWHLDVWYASDAGEPVGEAEVIDRLGSAEQLAELCRFLTAQVTDAMTQTGAGPGVGAEIGENVVFLVLWHEGVLGGDAMVTPVARSCGLSDRQGWWPGLDEW